MIYCYACGRENADNARFCIACGTPMFAPGAPAPAAPVPPPRGVSGTSTLQTSAMVIGLITAAILLIGGCSGFLAGSAAESFEEAFETELDDPDDGITSTTEDVSGAGAFAVVISILLFLGTGLAWVALRTSLILLALAMPMLIGLVAVDTTSLFAAAYYLAILLIGACVALMSIAFSRRYRAPR